MTFLDPVVLRGDLVTLEPMAPDHHDDLVTAARDGELWRLSFTSVPQPAAMAARIAAHAERQAAGSMLPFTVRYTPTGEVVGSTTFLNAAAEHHRVEIGYTWYAARFQRSGVNAETKLLMLTHAFETWDCVAVEFRTHWLNHRSRGALERLGAKLDGVLRSHQIMPDGSLRDTAVYSIVAAEWPAVRAELRQRGVRRSETT